ncbi:MEDS domain-containing protein [Variovorax sp. RT4R15]|uniref:MEDS domain-containing protein n=1 Tax=Variovorax sp. RT4R15 TaxID=3443737 RepID=UPI003F46BDF6
MFNAISASSPVARNSYHPELLDDPGHACGFFQSEDEEYEVLLPFIREGLGSGERVVHVIGPGKREEHLGRLTAAGIEVEIPLFRGQLVVIDWIQPYLPDGSFNQDRTSANFAIVRNQGRDLGFPRTRVICRSKSGLALRPSFARPSRRSTRPWRTTDG